MASLSQLAAIYQQYHDVSGVKGSPSELYDPVDYIMGLGGKRARPVLCLAASDLFNGDLQQALPLAYATELFHNFTLVHDDIMDQAPLRRGHHTVHKEFGMPRAILSGDVMMIYVYEYFKHLPDKAFRQVISVFNQAAIQVCEGQQLDMNFEQREHVALSEYLQMIKYKTAVLLGASLQIGGIAVGANEHDQQALYKAGVDTGIAFQIQDDILDSFGDEASFGKSIGGDIRQNKKTYLLVRAMELATGDDKVNLEHYLSAEDISPEEKVTGIKQLYNTLHVLEAAEQVRQEYHKSAIAALQSLSVAPEKLEPLVAYINSLFERKV
ncbi:polyprenyl synthetase family protein [soil metagenome]